MTRNDTRIAALGGLTLDRVVRAGRVHDDVAGGNALYAALGAWLYEGSVELVSFAGCDYPDAVLDRLDAVGVDVSLVRRSAAPSIRLWVLYEDDGSRQILYRADSSDLAVLEDVIPGVVRQQGHKRSWAAAHVGALPVRMQRPIVAQLGELGLHLTLDSIEAQGNVGGDLSTYLDDATLSHVTAFLPSEAEMAEICGPRSFEETMAVMASVGLRQLIVKRGRQGVDVHDLDAGTAVRVGAAESRGAVDPTGAGDVFCGAFIAASIRGMPAAEAAVAGSAAASFVVEEVGAMHLLAVSAEQLRQREATVRITPLPTEPA